MTNQQAPEALRPIARYKIGYHTDEWGMRSSTPSGIPDRAGAWVRYEDHIAALVEAQQPATHVQNPAEIEHVAGDVSKNGPKSNMAQQPAPSEQQPFGWIKQSEIDSSNDFGGSINLWRRKYDCDVPVYLAPQPSPTPQADSQPASDPADIIAGALQTSRGHAMELMQQAVDADRAASAPADSVTAPAESDWDVRGHLATSLSFWHRLKNGEDDELVAAFRKWVPPFWTVELDELRRAFRPHDLTQEWTSEHSRNYPGKAARIINAASAAVLTATATPPAQAADSVLEDAARLEQIAEAIRDYHHALDMRKHGGLAESAAFSSICNTMGMHWNRGEEAARRAARKQGANHD